MRLPAPHHPQALPHLRARHTFLPQGDRMTANRLKHIDPKISKAARIKVLTLDIETRPNLAHVWGLWQQNVGLSQIVERGHVMCWVAKWYGEKDPIFMSDHHD